MDEQMVWKGSSAWVVNFGAYVLSVLAMAVIVAAALLLQQPLVFAALVLPLGVMLWVCALNRTRVYEVTTQRVKITTGILTKRTEELELYRVRDSSLVEPFLSRLIGAGNIVLTTVDATAPTTVLEAIPSARDLKEALRQHVEACRERKNVRVTEFTDDTPGH